MQPDQINPQEMLRQQKAVQDVDAVWRKRFEAAVQDRSLRQWCVERATSVATADAVKLAAELHQFITGAYQLLDGG